MLFMSCIEIHKDPEKWPQQASTPISPYLVRNQKRKETNPRQNINRVTANLTIDSGGITIWVNEGNFPIFSTGT